MARAFYGYPVTCARDFLLNVMASESGIRDYARNTSSMIINVSPTAVATFTPPVINGRATCDCAFLSAT